MTDLESIFVRRIKITNDLVYRVRRSKYGTTVKKLSKQLNVQPVRIIYHMFRERSVGRCLICKGFTRFVTLRGGYGKYCLKCCNSPEAIELKKAKAERTFLSRYGVSNPQKSKEVRDRTRKTCVRKYGVEHPWSNEKVKEKIRSTMIERFGVENPNQNPTIRKKIEATCRKRYGESIASKSDLIKDKTRRTNKIKYGKHPSKLASNKARRARTNRLRYGHKTPYENAAVRERGRVTLQERYGVDNAFQSKRIKRKIQQTHLRKRGVRHHAQDPDTLYRMHVSAHRMRHITISGKRFAYQGYEKYLLKYLVSKYGVDRVVTERNAVPKIWYSQKGRRRYYPDALVGNTVFEVKSTYTFGINTPAKFKNLRLKARACEKAGLRFLCIVYDREGRKLLQSSLHKSFRHYRKLIKARSSF